MMRFAFYLILLIAAAAGVAWGMTQGTGYVLITFDRFRYESTLWVFLGLLLGAWLAVFLLRRVFKLLLISGAVVNPWSRRNRERRVLKASLHGQRELAEGRWNQALEHLSLAADNDSRPLVHFLGAARAANEMSQYEQCDKLLAKALNREPESALAIGLTKAQLLIERGDHSAARDTLSDLHREFPKQAQVLALLHKLYVQLEDWEHLCKLLPELRRQKVLSDVKLEELEQLAWRVLLTQSGRAASSEAADVEIALAKLEQRWYDMPSRLQGDALLVQAYAGALRDLGLNDKALAVLSAALQQRFERPLVELYGQVQAADSMQQLLQAEAWLEANKEDPVLLLALGRLSARNELWDKARHYLEDSLRFAYRSETCAELARVVGQLGDKERSNQLFMESLALLDRSLPVLQ